MISSAQIRAARGILAISASELAERAGVTWKTVQRFESAVGIPSSRSGTLARVQLALEDLGVEFVGDPIRSPGVRLHKARPI